MVKKKGKNKKKDDEKKDDFMQVDREFYLIQIEDLNRKLARLESKCADMEAENEAVRLNMDKLDEDRGDIISHLRRTLQKKVDEVSELTERIDALQMAKETEGSLYKEKIKNMENDFKAMHEQLTSEIKLLNGKLNSLEEFRAQREDLMAKFERQEQALEDQEKRHDQQLLDLEQSYLVRKERLKEEMEARLLKLSLDFQKATQMRIASTTQSVIRENIAVNNQLNTLVAEWKRICEEIDTLKSNNRHLLLSEEMNLKERKIVERKNLIQGEIISKLANKGVALKLAAQEATSLKKRLERLECELSEARRCERLAINNLGIAKQHLHATAVQYNELKVTHNKQEQHAFKLEKTLSKASQVVKQVLELSVFPDSNENSAIKRAKLLKTLQELLELDAEKKELIRYDSVSQETMVTIRGPSEKYKTGDLGLVPPRKPTEEHSEEFSEEQQDMSWDNEADITKVPKRIRNYIAFIESIIYTAKTTLKKISQLPENVKSLQAKEDIHKTRLSLLKSLQNILDSVIIQTARPLPLPSLESINILEGLLPEKFEFPTDKDVIREYNLSEIEPPCQEEDVSE